MKLQNCEITKLLKYNTAKIQNCETNKLWTYKTPRNKKYKTMKIQNVKQQICENFILEKKKNIIFRVQTCKKKNQMGTILSY